MPKIENQDFNAGYRAGLADADISGGAKWIAVIIISLIALLNVMQPAL